MPKSIFKPENFWVIFKNVKCDVLYEQLVGVLAKEFLNAWRECERAIWRRKKLESSCLVVSGRVWGKGLIRGGSTTPTGKR